MAIFVIATLNLRDFRAEFDRGNFCAKRWSLETVELWNCRGFKGLFKILLLKTGDPFVNGLVFDSPDLGLSALVKMANVDMTNNACNERIKKKVLKNQLFGKQTNRQTEESCYYNIDSLSLHNYFQCFGHTRNSFL